MFVEDLFALENNFKIGNHLLGQAALVAKNLSFSSMSLNAMPGSEHFYYKLGFEKTYYKTDEGINLILPLYKANKFIL